MTGPSHFGTDGVRGVANEGWLAPERVLALGRAIGRMALKQGGRVAIARDPRRSSPMIAGVLQAGISSEGADVLDLGVLPTPGLAVLLADLDAAVGIMVSASHNPMPDNGIKVLKSDGSKIDESEELWLEQQVEVGPGAGVPTGAGLGEVRTATHAVECYVDHLLARFEGLRLEGLKIVIDAANGATSVAGPRLLERLGADVVAIHSDPDGLNINEGCGSVHPDILSKVVREQDADIGVALDGDGDRSIFVSSDGSLQDGDHILFICARRFQTIGSLKDNTVVGTVMTNYGLELSLEEAGVRLERTPVGDRHVAAALRENDWSLGGEQSGHLIFGSDNGYVGDGIFSVLKVLEVMKEAQEPLHVLSGEMKEVPQVLINVPVREKPPLEDLEGVTQKIREGETALAGTGRVLVRYSGTESLLRVMVEGQDREIVERIGNDIAASVRVTIGKESVSH